MVDVSSKESSWVNLLNNLNQEQKRLLLGSSYLAVNQPLPMELIKRLISLENEDDWVKLINELTGSELISYSDQNYYLGAEAVSFLQKQIQKFEEEEILTDISRLIYDLTKNMTSADEFEPYAGHIEVLSQKGQVKKIATAGLLYGLLGRYKLKLGDEIEAVKFIKRSLLIVEKVSGVESVEHTENINNLGSALHRMGLYEDAKKCFEQAIIIDKRILGKKDPAVAVGHNNLGQVLLDMHNIEGAIIHLEKALEINTENFGKDSIQVAASNYNLGMALVSVGDIPRARAQLELSLLKRKKFLKPDHAEIADSHHGLGMLTQALGDQETAINHYQEAIRIFELQGDKFSAKLAASYTNLGGIYHFNKDFEKAMDLYQKAIQLFTAVFSEDDKNVRELKLQMGLIEVGMTMPDLLEKLEKGEQLPAKVQALLDASFQ